jgi:hypothetical protein
MPEKSDQTRPAATRPRSRRRLLFATLVVVVVAVLPSLWGRPFDSDRFYAYLEQHPTAHAVIRPLFQLAGKQAEFDSRILMAMFLRVLQNVDGKFETDRLLMPQMDAP